MFTSYQPQQALPKARLPNRPAGRLSLVFDEIRTSRAPIPDSELKTLRTVLEDGKEKSPAFLFQEILNLPDADQYESRFNTLGRVLNYIHETDSDNYRNALLAAMHQINVCCFDKRIKFEVFANTLVEQACNFAPEKELGYLRELMRLIFENLLWLQGAPKDFEKSEREAIANGGIEAVYQKTGIWPLHIAWNSANAGVNILAKHILSRLPDLILLENGVLTEKAISDFVTEQYLVFNAAPVVAHRLISVHREQNAVIELVPASVKAVLSHPAVEGKQPEPAVSDPLYRLDPGKMQKERKIHKAQPYPNPAEHRASYPLRGRRRGV